MKARAPRRTPSRQLLAFLQHARLQLYMTGFVYAVDVAECRREQVSAADRIEPTRHFQRVLGRRVEFRRVISDDIVLFATDGAGLDFEHEIVLSESLEQLLGNIEIFLQRKIAPVEHVTGEKIRPAGGAAPLGFLDEREDEFVELVLETMIGVQRDVNRVTLRGAVNVLGDRDRTERRSPSATCPRQRHRRPWKSE